MLLPRKASGLRFRPELTTTTVLLPTRPVMPSTKLQHRGEVTNMRFFDVVDVAARPYAENTYGKVWKD